MLVRVADWDDAYANGPNIPNIPGGERWPAAWVEPARAFREGLGAHAEIDIAYGPGPRELLDLFMPEGAPRGLVLFVHGGFWIRLDKSYWSHLAAGSLARGWAVAMPSYTLAPDARVGEIARQIAAALVEAAGRVKGPIHLTGHSAGGHLVTRLVSCSRDGTSLLPADVAGRIGRVVSISGVHDLRPLLETTMNASIGLDAAEADAESPALLVPDVGIDVVTWVGQSERAEFVRQSDLLANIWRGLGAATGSVVEPDRHHFDVIDGLTDPSSPLVEALLADGSCRAGAGEPA